MDFHALAPYAPYALFAVAAAMLFATGQLLARRRFVRAFANGGTMTLMEAAATVYETASNERLVIVTVAEKSEGGPVDWFARSIASVVPVFRIGGARTSLRFAAGAGIGEDLQSLYIERRALRTYLRWARSVQ